MKRPLAGTDKGLWIVAAAVALIAIGVLVWTQASKRAGVRIAVPDCSDPVYLRDVQQILGFNGLKQVRLDRELAVEAPHRRCGLIAQDANGKEVRVRGLIRRVGADVQLSVEFE